MAGTVAFVGLGQMGAGMARCLVGRGFGVRGYDVRSDATAALEHDGGAAAQSAADAARGAECAVVIVLNADQAEQATFDEQGLAETLPGGAVVVCMTTMAPSRARGLAKRASEMGLRWIDAPVSGGAQRAAEGSLTTMVGGDAADLERVRDVLDGFSRHIFHLGPVGSGSTCKMVNQVLVYNHLAAAVEAMTLARKAGADRSAIYDVICTAMGNSAIYASRVPHLIDGTYASGGSLRIALKDLAIVEDAAREMNLPMPMTAQATQLYRAAAAMGLLDQDDLVVGQVLQRLAGFD